MAILTTARGSFPYPNGAENFDVVTDLQALADRIAAVGGLFDQGVFASRPTSTPGTPGTEGLFYYSTDRRVLSYDYGTGWEDVWEFANSGFLSSNGYSLDGGPAHYAAGGNGLNAEIGTVGTAPRAVVDVALTMLYPVTFKFAGWALTYAGPGTQYHGIELQFPVGTPVFQSNAGITSFGQFNHEITLTAARLDALGNAGTWRLMAKGGADGVRTAGYRDITLEARERPDLV